MSKGRPWYRRYPDDFINGTLQLSLEQKGAYSVCLDLMYQRGGPIPDDPRWLARVCGCSVQLWKKIRAALIELGKLNLTEDGKLMNGRVSYEMERDREVSAVHSARGRLGGRPRKSSNKVATLSATSEEETPQNNDLGKPDSETQNLESESKQHLTEFVSPREPAREQESITSRRKHPANGHMQRFDPRIDWIDGEPAYAGWDLSGVLRSLTNAAEAPEGTYTLGTCTPLLDLLFEGFTSSQITSIAAKQAERGQRAKHLNFYAKIVRSEVRPEGLPLAVRASLAASGGIGRISPPPALRPAREPPGPSPGHAQPTTAPARQGDPLAGLPAWLKGELANAEVGGQ